MSLTTSIRLAISAQETGSADLGTPEFSAALAWAKALASGITSGKADLMWSDKRTLGASASEELDLAGVLTDLLGGATLTFAKIKAIVIVADDANVNDVVVGNATANQFLGPLGAAAHTQAVAPGMPLLWANTAGGWAVGAGTSDKLKIANGGGTTGVTYSIIIVGTSA